MKVLKQDDSLFFFPESSHDSELIHDLQYRGIDSWQLMNPRKDNEKFKIGLGPDYLRQPK